LAFLIILVGSSSFPAEVESVAAMRIQIIVGPAKPQLPVVRERFATISGTQIVGFLRGAIGTASASEVNGRENSATNNPGERIPRMNVQFIVDLAHPTHSSSYDQMVAQCVGISEKNPGSEPGFLFQA